MGVNIVTGGEDGRITVLRTNDLQPLTVIGMWIAGRGYRLMLGFCVF